LQNVENIIRILHKKTLLKFNGMGLMRSLY